MYWPTTKRLPKAFPYLSPALNINVNTYLPYSQTTRVSTLITKFLQVRVYSKKIVAFSMKIYLWTSLIILGRMKYSDDEVCLENEKLQNLKSQLLLAIVSRYSRTTKTISAVYHITELPSLLRSKNCIRTLKQVTKLSEHHLRENYTCVC